MVFGTAKDVEKYFCEVFTNEIPIYCSLIAILLVWVNRKSPYVTDFVTHAAYIYIVTVSVEIVVYVCMTESRR